MRSCGIDVAYIVSRMALHDWPGEHPLTIRTGETDSCHTKISKDTEFMRVWQILANLDQLWLAVGLLALSRWRGSICYRAGANAQNRIKSIRCHPQQLAWAWVTCANAPGDIHVSIRPYTIHITPMNWCTNKKSSDVLVQKLGVMCDVIPACQRPVFRRHSTFVSMASTIH